MFMMITRTVLFLILKSTESSTPGSGPIKTINKRGSFQMLCRTSLAATPFIIAIQDCLHSLHRLLSQASFFILITVSKLMKFNCTVQVKTPDQSKTNDLHALQPGGSHRLDSQGPSGLTDFLRQETK